MAVTSSAGEGAKVSSATARPTRTKPSRNRTERSLATSVDRSQVDRSSVEVRCEDRDLATKVTNAKRQRTSTRDLSTWDLSTEVAKDRSVRFRLGFVRVGRTVAQLTFAPSPADDVTATSFHALLVRAGDRLRELG